MFSGSIQRKIWSSHFALPNPRKKNGKNEHEKSWKKKRTQIHQEHGGGRSLPEFQQEPPTLGTFKRWGGTWSDYTRGNPGGPPTTHGKMEGFRALKQKGGK